MRRAVVILIALLGALVPHPAAAQVDCGASPSDPACKDTPPDEGPEEPDPAPTTATTAPPATTATTATTTRPPTTRPATTAPRSTGSGGAGDGPATTEATVPAEGTTTTTSQPELLEEGPPTSLGVTGAVQEEVTSTTEEPAAEDDNEGRTARQVTLVVAGLLVLALAFGGLTFWYWRRTRPGVKPARARP